MRLFFILAGIIVILLISANSAMSSTIDVVYLKDGGIIKGMIIEQVPGVSLKIQTKDGNVFVYSYDEIDKIAKEFGEMGMGTESGPKKNPGVAFVLSWVMPGVGQFYNGDVGKGVIQLVGVVAGWTTFFIAYPSTEWHYDYYYDGYDYNYNYYYEDTGNTAVAWIGFGAAVGCQLWSMIDAPLSASKINKKRGYTFNEIQLKDNITLSLMPVDFKRVAIEPNLKLTYRF